MGNQAFGFWGSEPTGQCEANVVVFGVVVVAVTLALAVGVAVAVLVVIVVVAVAAIVIAIVMDIVTFRSVAGVIVIGVVTVVVVVVGGIVVSVACCMCGECTNVAPNFSSRPEGGRLRKKDGANFSNSEKSHSDTLLA